MTNRCSVVVFAHNEAAGIANTINSIIDSAQEWSIDVVVLANGCTDRTIEIVRDLEATFAQVRLVEIALGDKANAWNHYVHKLSDVDATSQPAMHVFVDGDVKVESGALAALWAVFGAVPSVNAVGAMPASGRDRVAWSDRMVKNCTLAGGMYALSDAFVARIRHRAIHIPRGMIGEDWLVSLLANIDLNQIGNSVDVHRRVLFAPDARFTFRSLNPWSARDGILYMKRLWRYALRAVQYEMVFNLLVQGPPETLPDEIEQVYRMALPPSRLKWVGSTTILRFFAVQKVRNIRGKRAANTSMPRL